MSKVVFQKEIPATPPSGTPIKVTEISDGDVQHVNVDTVPAYTPITQYVVADANNSSTTNLDSPTYTYMELLLKYWSDNA